jgi:hemerythrin
MGIFQWTERYAVQVTDFDRQHKSLFRMVNELHEALGRGRGKDVVGKILQQLIEYTATHFAEEEAAMEKNGFPELKSHEAEHRSMTEQILKFQKDFQAGKVGVATALMLFLQKWLHDHLLETDKKYGPFLNEKGIH